MLQVTMLQAETLTSFFFLITKIHPIIPSWKYQGSSQTRKYHKGKDILNANHHTLIGSQHEKQTANTEVKDVKIYWKIRLFISAIKDQRTDNRWKFGY